MSFILFARFTKLSLLRAVFWLVMGISLLLMPDFLLGGLFYVLIGYLLINAFFRIVFFTCETTAEYLQNNKGALASRYAGLMIAVLFLIVAVHFIIYREWLNEFTPVFLGGLLILEGMLYFVIALCAATTLQKLLLVILSGATFLQAIIAIAFTFGFGIGGLTGMTKVLGIALLLAFLYEIAAFCANRRNQAIHFDQENTKKQ